MKTRLVILSLVLHLTTFGFLTRECRAEEASAIFGARFKEGKGIEVSPETKGIIGLQTAEVKEEQEGTRTVAIVPASALLKTITGQYVYVVNGDHYLRTQVTTSDIDKQNARIVDGLFAGDEVVTTPVNSLWYAELQALRGGKACADGH